MWKEAESPRDSLSLEGYSIPPYKNVTPPPLRGGTLAECNRDKSFVIACALLYNSVIIVINPVEDEAKQCTRFLTHQTLERYLFAA